MFLSQPSRSQHQLSAPPLDLLASSTIQPYQHKLSTLQKIVNEKDKEIQETRKLFSELSDDYNSLLQIASQTTSANSNTTAQTRKGSLEQELLRSKESVSKLREYNETFHSQLEEQLNTIKTNDMKIKTLNDELGTLQKRLILVEREAQQKEQTLQTLQGKVLRSHQIKKEREAQEASLAKQTEKANLRRQELEEMIEEYQQDNVILSRDLNTLEEQLQSKEMDMNELATLRNELAVTREAQERKDRESLLLDQEYKRLVEALSKLDVRIQYAEKKEKETSRAITHSNHQLQQALSMSQEARTKATIAQQTHKDCKLRLQDVEQHTMRNQEHSRNEIKKMLNSQVDPLKQQISVAEFEIEQLDKQIISVQKENEFIQSQLRIAPSPVFSMNVTTSTEVRRPTAIPTAIVSMQDNSKSIDQLKRELNTLKQAKDRTISDIAKEKIDHARKVKQRQNEVSTLQISLKQERKHSSSLRSNFRQLEDKNQDEFHRQVQIEIQKQIDSKRQMTQNKLLRMQSTLNQLHDEIQKEREGLGISVDGQQQSIQSLIEQSRTEKNNLLAEREHLNADIEQCQLDIQQSSYQINQLTSLHGTSTAEITRLENDQISSAQKETSMRVQLLLKDAELERFTMSS
ncbi:hypothetical protein BLNAU_10830 [Blattamonas nauphoetae]|uniref:Uncharacterized protein n=1 Tax=Blattamonas nauphoetae TaxID=2049346 RepID=A0ABQ9XSV6_9EUKA|nr:hypothetical protein BLNAU_10830 [Blattamonas nauphoetae]